MSKKDEEHLKYILELYRKALKEFSDMDPNDILGFFRLHHLLAILPFGKSTLYTLMQTGGFPKGVCIGSRIRVWPKIEILKFLRDFHNK